MSKLIFPGPGHPGHHSSPGSQRREEGAFCVVRQGRTAMGTRLLVTDVILPTPGAWERQGQDQLRPSARGFRRHWPRHRGQSRTLFLHSHPDARFPVEMSLADRIAFTTLARDLAPMLDGPFAAAVVHPYGWSGTLWSDGVLQPIEHMMSVGRTMTFLSPLPRAEDSDIMRARQREMPLE